MRPFSEVPTASSVYSQPSPEFDDHRPVTPQLPPRSSSLYPEDISPPDTPDAKEEHNMPGQVSPDISPISATPSPTADRYAPLSASGSKRYNSNLPIPKSNTKKFWKLPNSAKGSQNPEESNVRWDEYSGEPTAGDKGKPPSATPGSIKLRETPSPLRLKPTYGTSTHITGGNDPARKRVGSRETTEAPIAERPEWKGASGRHSIVRPVFDKPSSQSTKYPAGSHQKWLEEQERERIKHEQFEREQEELEAAKQAKERLEQEQREREQERQQRMARERIEKAKRERERIQQAQGNSERRARERVERVPPPAVPEPLRVASRTPSATQTPTQLHPAPTPSEVLDAIEAEHRPVLHPTISGTSSHSTTPSMQDPKTRVAGLIVDDRRSPLARNPSHEELRDRRNDSLPSLPQGSHPDNHQTPSGPRQLPPSNTNQIESELPANLNQMSIYNQPQSRFSATTVATTVYDNSPPQTPEVGSNVSSSTTTPTSILNRKRPVAPAGVVRRKPTPSDIPLGTSNGITRKTSKSLPKPPPEAQASDPIQALRAKQDVLRRRRRNLESVINELTSVAQPSSIAYDRASRTEIKRTVAGLEKELAEVVKDEHETGLKLHRAWKRHDNFADFEPTSFWVRRVTT